MFHRGVNLSGSASPMRAGLQKEEWRESTFAGLCASIAKLEDGVKESDFPLRGHVHLRSSIDLKFASREFAIEYPRMQGGHVDALPTLRVAFLSLAGAGGPLPLALSERMLSDHSDGSKALHVFLDLLNRRFWELLFFSQGVGGNAHYALLDRRHASMLANISFAITGLSDQLRLEDASIGAPLLRRIKRNCVAASSGAGDLRDLGQLLSQMLDAVVQMRQYEPIRLKVIPSSIAALGSVVSGASLARGAVIGLYAWVACAMVATVRVSHHLKLRHFLPGGAGFAQLQELLGIFSGHARTPVRLRLQSPVDDSLSELGRSGMTLGWGARLKGDGPACQIVEIRT